MDSLQVTKLHFDSTLMLSPSRDRDFSHGVVVNFNGLKACPALRQTATACRPEALPRLSITATQVTSKEGTLKALQSLSWTSTEAPAHASSFTVHASAAAIDAPAVVAPSKQKIRIKLRSYWVDLIEQACKQILDAGKNTNAQTMGPVPLPTKRRVYCLLRSPHVDKDSREHFEIRTHRRLIDLANPTAQTIDALMQLDLPAGVDVEVKLS